MSASSPVTNSDTNSFSTCILPIDLKLLATHISHNDTNLTHLRSTLPNNSPSAAHLSTAATALRTTNIPVAFPTETVYGLGADATSSSAVRGIFAAKNRPADNPLIVHIASLSQLRRLLGPASSSHPKTDSIPAIYQPLIARFWPGPLTILLPVPAPGIADQTLAPEVTAGLTTFGARMPASPLALALIHETNRPLAAPSANSSTRPSPTRAAHVLHDLHGRIEYILDGGDCEVGVESTVVDGLSSTPAVLRPGGVSLEAIRGVRGWEGTVVAYRDEAEGDEKGGRIAPRAPGMKYKHYSPNARVVLVKAGLVGNDGLGRLVGRALQGDYERIGVLRGPMWEPVSSLGSDLPGNASVADETLWRITDGAGGNGMQLRKIGFTGGARKQKTEVVDAAMGRTAEEVARNLFRGLREMDLHKVDLIFVEGVDDASGEAAAAVMNRLRKAAETKINSPEDMHLHAGISD